MEGLEDHPRLGHRDPRRGVDAAHPVHAAQAEQKLITARVGGGATDHTAVAALRYQRDQLFGTKTDDGGDLFGRSWGQHRRGAPRIFTAPVGEPRRHGFGIIRVALWTQQPSQTIEKRLGWRSGHA